MSALRESVSFGRFLSESLEWDAMARVLPAPTGTIVHDPSPPAARLERYMSISPGRPQRLELNLPPPTVVLHASEILDQA